MLSIRNLQASVGDKPILKGINLDVKAGEVHAIMGPNGSGKSTLSNVLAGRENATVTGGSVTYQGKDLLALAVEERAREGIFLAFQYPWKFPGWAMSICSRLRSMPSASIADYPNWTPWIFWPWSRTR